MTRNFRARPVGWRGESHRHYLASKGVSTRRFVPRSYMSGNFASGSTAYYEDKAVSDFERLHREGVRRERIPDYVEQVDLSDREKVILDRLKADDELASPAFRSALDARHAELAGRSVDPRFAASAERIDRRTRRYNYVPTYAVGDMSLIAADGLGTAGAAGVSMIPVIVPVLLAYGGAKYIANKKKKTGSYFTIKRKHAQGVLGYEDSDSGKFFYDLESAEKFVAENQKKHLLRDQMSLSAEEKRILSSLDNPSPLPKTTNMVIGAGIDPDKVSRNAALAAEVRALRKSRVPVKRVKGPRKVKKKKAKVVVEEDVHVPVESSVEDRAHDLSVWRSGRPAFRRYDRLDDLSEKDYAYDVKTELSQLKKDEAKLPLRKGVK